VNSEFSGFKIQADPIPLIFDDFQKPAGFYNPGPEGQPVNTPASCSLGGQPALLMGHPAN
jgi:hypothetical protein